MRRTLVALVILLTPILVVPSMTAAQEATPQPSDLSTAGNVERTDTRLVVPFTADGLSSNLSATSTVEGACTSDSSIANGRPDAWGCTSEDSGVFDPCFENTYLSDDEPGQVACLDTPWSTDVVVLDLSAPLPRQKEAPGAGVGAADTAAEVILPWDLPWAVELANGDRCSLNRGTLIFQAGQVVHYGCENGGMILGEVVHSRPVWTVNYVADGELASSVVEVATAWS
jgi:hypothetical protein